MNQKDVVLMNDVDGRTVVVYKSELESITLDNPVTVFGLELEVVAAFVRGWHKLYTEPPTTETVRVFFNELHKTART